MDLKSAQLASSSHPPLYFPLHLNRDTLNATDTVGDYLTRGLSPHVFDVILVHPHGTWAETTALPIRQLSADPGFVFLWVGKGDDEGLERGRECLARWGFRRAEDIVWVKTNCQHHSFSKNEGDGTASEQDTVDEKQDLRQQKTQPVNRGVGGGGLLASQKEHCLMGIRGTVRRSTDTRFVHCNVDTDIMVWECDEGE